MRLLDFLRKKTRIGDIVIFREYGWQLGMTRIDNENLYLRMLNPSILNNYIVTGYKYEPIYWAVSEVLIVDILPDNGVRHNETL